MRTGLLIASLLLTSAGHVLSRAGEVRMIEVTGEGARFWPRWRGPSGQGFVAPGSYTNWWSPTAKIKWRTRIPGSGNSSPIVWADRIYVTTSQNNGAKLSLLAFNRADGRLLWEAVVPQQGTEYVHPKNGYASATGENVFNWSTGTCDVPLRVYCLEQ